MKKVLYIQCAFLAALLLSAGCSTSGTARSNTPAGTTAVAYTGTSNAEGGATTAGRYSTTSTESTTEQTTNQVTTVNNNSGTLPTETANQADIALRKEELVVGKREVSNGSVIVRKVVNTQNVSQPVELRREEYVVERIPANDARNQSIANTDTGHAFQAEEIFIPLMREEPVVGKRAILTENVRIGKRVETTHQTITQPIRMESIDIVKNPNNMPNQAQGVGAAPANVTQSTETASNASNPQNIVNPAGTESLSLAREELVVGKRDVNNGGVLLRKVVQTENASQPVDLRREEFTIDRTPANNQVVNNADFSNQEIRLDLMREEPVVTTRNYVTEIVHVRKKVETDNQTVSGTVRQENVEVVQNGTSTNLNTSASMNLNNNNTITGQGGTSSAAQSGSSTISESSSNLRNTTTNTNVGRREPIPPPKAGEVLEYHDFSGDPTAHKP